MAFRDSINAFNQAMNTLSNYNKDYEAVLQERKDRAFNENLIAKDNELKERAYQLKLDDFNLREKAYNYGVLKDERDFQANQAQLKLIDKENRISEASDMGGASAQGFIDEITNTGSLWKFRNSWNKSDSTDTSDLYKKIEKSFTEYSKANRPNLDFKDDYEYRAFDKTGINSIKDILKSSFNEMGKNKRDFINYINILKQTKKDANINKKYIENILSKVDNKLPLYGKKDKRYRKIINDWRRYLNKLRDEE